MVDHLLGDPPGAGTSRLEVLKRIAILGAGPTGLEAALAALEAGYPFTVYEASPSAAGHIRDWGHVRLFTPWSLNVSPRMARALEQAGSQVPEGDGCPTGSELVERLFQPISSLPPLAEHIRYGVRVDGIGRAGFLKSDEIGTGRRADRPFRILLGSESRGSWVEEADIVMDCTGNSVPNALGDGGIPAPGEAEASKWIFCRIPDLELDGDAWADQRVLVVGDGHSATTAVSGLVDLATRSPGTEIVWTPHGDVPAPDPADPLLERARLMQSAHNLATDPPQCLTIRLGAVVDSLVAPETEGAPLEVRLRHEDGRIECVHVHRVLALTGKVGDHQLYRQLQVHECWATSGPMKLAGALLAQSGSGADCLDQKSFGAETLAHPEPGFFILGVKSYGRRSDFLMRVGWEQIEDVFGLLASPTAPR